MVKKIISLVTQQEKVVNEKLLNVTNQDVNTLLKSFKNTVEGYNEKQVVASREEFGENILQHKKEQPWYKLLLSSLLNPFSIVLIILASISFFTKDYVAVSIIIVMVLLGAILSFMQEYKSSKAVEKLTELVETKITVQRLENHESIKMEIPMDELVVGDILHLSAGDIIPADARLIQARDFFVSQSSLTGESEPVEKFGETLIEKPKQALEANNLVFMGCNIISGSAQAIVVAIGSNTVFGNIANQLQEKPVITSFEKGVNSVSWIFIRFMLIMAPIVLLLNGFTKGNWLEAFLFALSVAVGLTPEMLPMIVSVNLAKGAIAMSKKKVIVKKLNAIQNFGAMDVLCTDKTGTITQDKVSLKYYLNIHGQEDDRILRHGFLNSYYQTGLKNLMDIAIINHVQDSEQQDLFNNYKKIDEIPFDFNRRRMSVVVENTTNESVQLITKGAIEEMLSICTHAEYADSIELLTDEIRKEILNRCYDYNEQGFRVLGIAHKSLPSIHSVISVADEEGMVLLGYLAFFDPPKESTKDALNALSEYGVNVKVLTGDNDAVTRYICNQVGLNGNDIILGEMIETMNDEDLKKCVEKVDVFAKLSPAQKTRIVEALRNDGHTVGFMGDGINDASAMKMADVGISVDSAVDIAKESASIILLEKDLMVLENGIIEGRKTYANIMKYIKITASSNFGNMFSILVASAFLPFMPMLPLQILILNLIYDISCTAIPWDNVDEDYLKEPKQWNANSISKFMIYIGPTSSIFDILTYVILFFGVCPFVFGGAYHTLNPATQLLFVGLFQTGWFVESLWTQTSIIHMLRSSKMPFKNTFPSKQLIFGTTFGILVGTLLPMTAIGKSLNMMQMPFYYYFILLGIIIMYMIVVTKMKKIYIKKFKELL